MRVNGERYTRAQRIDARPNAAEWSTAPTTEATA
jgi:hypothetical protein